jgi:hypothetical protein
MSLLRFTRLASTVVEPNWQNIIRIPRIRTAIVPLFFKESLDIEVHGNYYNPYKMYSLTNMKDMLYSDIGFDCAKYENIEKLKFEFNEWLYFLPQMCKNIDNLDMECSDNHMILSGENIKDALDSLKDSRRIEQDITLTPRQNNNIIVPPYPKSII